VYVDGARTYVYTYGAPRYWDMNMMTMMTRTTATLHQLAATDLLVGRRQCKSKRTCKAAGTTSALRAHDATLSVVSSSRTRLCDAPTRVRTRMIEPWEDVAVGSGGRCMHGGRSRASWLLAAGDDGERARVRLPRPRKIAGGAGNKAIMQGPVSKKNLSTIRHIESLDTCMDH
jgi:hypothetical protein